MKLHRPRLSLTLLMVLHACMLGYLASHYSPTLDEVAHLPAGLLIWKHGDFSVYRVNPPLVRATAAFPVSLMTHHEDWTGYSPNADVRLEWGVGRRFMNANGPDSFHLFRIARWACMPFSLIGLLVTYLWGRELGSERVGFGAATLWCFSPNLLGHGALITPDVAATSLNLLAAWRFSKWLNETSWRQATLCGLALGVTLLSKLSWIIIPPAWLILGGFHAMASKDSRERLRVLTQVLAMQVLGVSVLNMGYLYEGTFTKLGDFHFYSRSLSGQLRIPGEELPGNRFSETLLGKVPVPLPADYVTGIDLQKLDFEKGTWNYFFGEIRQSDGWWNYYLVGLFMKVPLGVWLLSLMVIPQVIGDAQFRRLATSLLPLLIPVTILFMTASLQTGMNRHIRYVFPVLPAVYLLGAIATRNLPRLSFGIIASAVGSSLLVFPHSIAYFNESVGGPNRGHHYLIDSNLDWGQDMRLVREWIESNPDHSPLHIAWIGDVPLQTIGIEAEPVPQAELSSGWYLISRHRRHDPAANLDRFNQFSPTGRIGWTFDVYHIQE